jgi:hypothetical protein
MQARHAIDNPQHDLERQARVGRASASLDASSLRAVLLAAVVAIKPFPHPILLIVGQVAGLEDLNRFVDADDAFKTFVVSHRAAKFPTGACD